VPNVPFDARPLACGRCGRAHGTEQHYTRKVAASALGRGLSVAEAAARARMPLATLEYWLEHDTEFKTQIAAAAWRDLKKGIRRFRRAARANSDPQVGDLWPRDASS
jgi:hypothetical protein